VIDEEHDKGSSATGDLEAFTEAGGEKGGAVDVLADVFGSAGIVEDEGDVEGVGVGMFEEEVAVDGAARVFVINEGIELVDAAEGVLVGGVAVEEFVLNEAVERAEFREVSSEDAGAMHEAEDVGDLAFFLEDFAEGYAVFGAKSEGLIDKVPMFFDELAERGGRADIVLLAVGEEADETAGVFFEDGATPGEEALVADGVVVERDGLLFDEAEGEL